MSTSTIFKPGGIVSVRPEDRARKKPRVLLVNPGRDAARATATHLEGEGYAVAIAHNLAEFDGHFARFSPNVVLIDVEVGAHRGDDLCRTLKRGVDTRLIPVMLVSNLPAEELRFLADAAQADGHICTSAGLPALIQALDDLVTGILF
jgi:CheY-like chemotaxis protein